MEHMSASSSIAQYCIHVKVLVKVWMSNVFNKLRKWAVIRGEVAIGSLVDKVQKQVEIIGVKRWG